MARAAETIVEEWLNRRGYFTIRSLKEGRTECDLLAFSPKDSDAVHVEVNVSINPIGWIGKKNLAGEKLPGGKDRTDEQVEGGIKNYVDKKYRSAKAIELRERLWPNHGNWRFTYVHGKLNYPERELPCLEKEGIEVRSVIKLLEELKSDNSLPFETDSNAAHFVALCQQLGR